MIAKQSVRPVAALALILAAGLPAHAGGGANSPICSPAPKKPSYVQNAVPEASDFALLSVGLLVLLTVGLRASKRPRPAD